MRERLLAQAAQRLGVRACARARRLRRLARDLELDRDRAPEEALAAAARAPRASLEPARAAKPAGTRMRSRAASSRTSSPAVERREEARVLLAREGAQPVEDHRRRERRRARRPASGAALSAAARRACRRARGARPLGRPARRRGGRAGRAPAPRSRASSASSRESSAATSSPAGSVASRTIAISSTANGCGAQARSSCSFTSARNMRRRRAGSQRAASARSSATSSALPSTSCGASGAIRSTTRSRSRPTRFSAEALGVDPGRRGPAAGRERAARRRPRRRPRGCPAGRGGRSGRAPGRPARRRPALPPQAITWSSSVCASRIEPSASRAIASRLFSEIAIALRPGDRVRAARRSRGRADGAGRSAGSARSP